jgi:hypothetical protein
MQGDVRPLVQNDGASMWHFLERYFGWYLWLAAYCTVIGALVGLACFTIVLLPLFLWFAPVLAVLFAPAGLAYAAPLNVLVLPVAFHCLRHSQHRQALLQLVGILGGFVSPGLVMLAAELADPDKTSSITRALLLTAQPNLARLALLSVAGAIAGVVCAKLFHKHGSKPSLFDINANLEALRRDRTLPS